MFKIFKFAHFWNHFLKKKIKFIEQFFWPDFRPFALPENRKFSSPPSVSRSEGGGPTPLCPVGRGSPTPPQVLPNPAGGRLPPRCPPAASPSACGCATSAASSPAAPRPRPTRGGGGACHPSGATHTGPLGPNTRFGFRRDGARAPHNVSPKLALLPTVPYITAGRPGVGSCRAPPSRRRASARPGACWCTPSGTRTTRRGRTPTSWPSTSCAAPACPSSGPQASHQHTTTDLAARYI